MTHAAFPLASGNVRATTDQSKLKRLYLVLPSAHPLTRNLAIDGTINIKRLSGERFVLLHRQSSPRLYDEVLALCRRAGKFSPHVVNETGLRAEAAGGDPGSDGGETGRKETVRGAQAVTSIRSVDGSIPRVTLLYIVNTIRSFVLVPQILATCVLS
jgi:hypothetical protein